MQQVYESRQSVTLRESILQKPNRRPGIAGFFPESVY